jgi:hypothetical protein
MLLRSSRVAGHLTKEALLAGIGRVAKGTLGFAGKHWKGLGGTAMVGTTVAPEIQKGVQKSSVGLSQPWLQASAAGMVPKVPV